MVRFHYVSVNQRQEHQENSELLTEKTDGNGSDDTSVGDKFDVGLAFIITRRLELLLRPNTEDGLEDQVAHLLFLCSL